MTENIRQAILKLNWMKSDYLTYGKCTNKHAYQYVKIKRQMNGEELKVMNEIENALPWKAEFCKAIEVVVVWP